MGIQSNINYGLNLLSWAMSDYYQTPQGKEKLEKRQGEKRYNTLEDRKKENEAKYNELSKQYKDNPLAIASIDDVKKSLNEEIEEEQDLIEKRDALSSNPGDLGKNYYKNKFEKTLNDIINKDVVDDYIDPSLGRPTDEQNAPEVKDPNVKTPQELNNMEVTPNWGVNPEYAKKSVANDFSNLNNTLNQNNELTSKRPVNNTPSSPILLPAARLEEKQNQYNAQKAAIEKIRYKYSIPVVQKNMLKKYENKFNLDNNEYLDSVSYVREKNVPDTSKYGLSQAEKSLSKQINEYERVKKSIDDPKNYLNIKDDLNELKGRIMSNFEKNYGINIEKYNSLKDDEKSNILNKDIYIHNKHKKINGKEEQHFITKDKGKK